MKFLELNKQKQAILGDIKISDDVLCAIAAVKTLEIEGVVDMSSNVVEGFTNLLGFKNMTQGVKIIKSDNNQISFTVYIVARYGYRIPDIALKIQEHVKTSIESLTDYIVASVNVYVQGLVFSDHSIHHSSLHEGTID